MPWFIQTHFLSVKGVLFGLTNGGLGFWWKPPKSWPNIMAEVSLKSFIHYLHRECDHAIIGTNPAYSLLVSTVLFPLRGIPDLPHTVPFGPREKQVWMPQAHTLKLGLTNGCVSFSMDILAGFKVWCFSFISDFSTFEVQCGYVKLSEKIYDVILGIFQSHEHARSVIAVLLSPRDLTGFVA